MYYTHMFNKQNGFVFTKQSMRIIRGSWSIELPRTSLSRVVVSEGVGVVDIYLVPESPVNVSPINSFVLFNVFGGLSIVYYRKEKRLSIPLFELAKDLTTTGYYQILDELRGWYTNVEEGMVNTPSEKKSMVDSYCAHCEKEYDYNADHALPTLVACPHCSKLQMDALCPKCGIGGLVIPEPVYKPTKPVINLGKALGLEWKATASKPFEEKPDHWHCGVCVSDWRISPAVYDGEPEMGVA